MPARPGARRAAGVRTAASGSGHLEEARRAASDRRWPEAYQQLSELDRRHALAADDLELLATSAFLLGRRAECRQARLRAYQLHLHGGDLRRAARCAAHIGLEQLDLGEVAEAAGCLPVSLSGCSAWAAQAEALVAREADGPERGYVLIPLAYEQLAIHADPVAAALTAEDAVDHGRRSWDPDLLALALAVQGRAMVRSCRVPRGLAVLDEAVTTVLDGGVSPLVAGLVLTSAVDAGDEVLDISRCHEWTLALAHWCERQDGIVAFRGRSLAHRAASARRRGRWTEAIDLAGRACAPPLAEVDPAAAAVARYERGDVLRLRGDLVGAAVAYRQTGELLLGPRPGPARLRLTEGDAAAARAWLERALGEAWGRLDRARLLPALVEALLAAGDRPAAAEAARELEQIADDHETAALEATARQARAAVLIADGAPSAALTAARAACRVWRHLGLPHEEAQTRLLVAASSRMLGDEAGAALELEAASEALARLGARPDLERARTVLDRTGHPATSGLTRREAEVLRLLATGLTNRTIAQHLHVTPRTVDTHVSSILTKLGVSTRTAATAFAHRHGLV
jgi:DNA-binding NarL/FixJ family response regulator